MRTPGSRHEGASADVIHLDINNEAIPTRLLDILLAKLIQTNELGKKQPEGLKAGLSGKQRILARGKQVLSSRDCNSI